MCLWQAECRQSWLLCSFSLSSLISWRQITSGLEETAPNPVDAEYIELCVGSVPSSSTDLEWVRAVSAGLFSCFIIIRLNDKNYSSYMGQVQPFIFLLYTDVAAGKKPAILATSSVFPHLSLPWNISTALQRAEPIFLFAAASECCCTKKGQLKSSGSGRYTLGYIQV